MMKKLLYITCGFVAPLAGMMTAAMYSHISWTIAFATILFANLIVFGIVVKYAPEIFKEMFQ